ncbi:hypothetical protein [Eudoraea adriatica]|uniref:hypothetical protein n=1 Tax=Eudoraea adriatica TaxID=446681 RepID=UPI0003601F74|nr:hypothetical protein [Eudoraea adriatica]
MELYIEKQFLDDFYLSSDEGALSIGQQALDKILKEYGMIDWFIDCSIDSPEEFEELEKENPLFAYRSNYSPPVTVKDIKTHFFKNSACEQTLIFCMEDHDWFQDAENKGALCFSFSNYEKKIEAIIKSCHKRFDLYEIFPGWQWFEFFRSIPLNFLTINDHFILGDASSQKIKDNLFPMLKILLENNGQNEIQIRVHTEKLNERTPKDEENKAKRIVAKLNSLFAKAPYKFQVVTNQYALGKPFHDRYLYSNFLIVKATRGFNLMPQSTGEDAEIECSSIFDRYHYRQINNRKALHDKYLSRLKSPGFSTLGFVAFPPL